MTPPSPGPAPSSSGPLSRSFSPSHCRASCRSFRSAGRPLRCERALGVALLAAAVGLAAGACTSPTPALRMRPVEGLTPDDYQEVLERWSRRDEIFNGLFSVMFLHATFHAPEFRRAFLLHFPDTYGRGSDEARRLTLAEPSAETHWEFFLSASTPRPRWNDLAQPDSIWHVTLRADEGPEVDAKVREIDLNANLRVFYPYLTPYSRGYGLEFPLTTLEGKPLISSSTREIVLRVSSALGTAEMRWALEPEGVAAERTDEAQTRSRRSSTVSDGGPEETSG